MSQSTKAKEEVLRLRRLLGLSNESIKICFAKNNDLSFSYLFNLNKAIKAKNRRERKQKWRQYYQDTLAYSQLVDDYIYGIIDKETMTAVDKKFEEKVSKWDLDSDSLIYYIISPSFGSGF